MKLLNRRFMFLHCSSVLLNLLLTVYDFSLILLCKFSQVLFSLRTIWFRVYLSLGFFKLALQLSASIP